MDVRKDFIPRLKVQESKDETFSHSGKKDFTPDTPPEIYEIKPRGISARPRTRASINNSYT